MKQFVNQNIYTILYILLAFIYISGTYIPLIENDSAQHAVMAMRMYLQNDFVNLFRGPDEYLDKPHLHFWLAALSYKIFGLNQFAYRVPALIFTTVAAYSCYQLFKDLYKNKQYAHWASLIFLSSQAIVLANHDVRTDAVLTGAVVLSVWQLYRFITYNTVKSIVIGAFAMGLAFSSKGLLGVAVIGFCLLSHIAYTKSWKVLINPKILIGILVLAATISPVLYAYYLQFDVHPEKVINGQDHISGIKFILWDQSFNRMTGTGFTPDNPDYFFFFHTILWVFLPWSLLFYIGIFTPLKSDKLGELLTIGGILITLVVISLSKTKLPHYLNSLIPLMSVYCAGFIYRLNLQKKDKLLKVLLYITYFVLGICFLGVFGLLFFTFGFPKGYILIITALIIAIIVLYLKPEKIIAPQIVILSVLASVLVNTTMNNYFYPHLMHYQSGRLVANYVHKHENDEQVYLLGKETQWSLDFYAKKLTPYIEPEELPDIKQPMLLMTNHPELLETLIKENKIKIDTLHTFEDFRVTRVSLRFLNPKTREKQLKKSYLLRFTPMK